MLSFSAVIVRKVLLEWFTGQINSDKRMYSVSQKRRYRLKDWKPHLNKPDLCQGRRS